jgi:hypothetical protein
MLILITPLEVSLDNIGNIVTLSFEVLLDDQSGKDSDVPASPEESSNLHLDNMDRGTIKITSLI